MGRYVVTGAAGFIASSLAEQLLRSGHDVVGLDSFTDYYPEDVKRRNAALIPVRELDLVQADLDAVLSAADGVYHLAAQPGVRSSWGADFAIYARDNVVASQRVFEAAARAGRRVVFASSSSVYGDSERYPTREDVEPQPRSPYGVTKLAAEHLARASMRSLGLDVVILRYFTVYGPRQRPDMAFGRIFEALALGSPFDVYGDGSQSRDFTYVDDAVQAAIVAMAGGRPGATYNVGGGSTATIKDAIAVCERVAGRTLDVRRRPQAPGDVRRTSADTTAIRSEFGWTPSVTLEDGLHRQWEWAAARETVTAR